MLGQRRTRCPLMKKPGAAGNRTGRASLALLATKTSAPEASEQPARKYSAIWKLFVESLIQPTTNGPAYPPRFPIELISAMPPAAAVSAQENRGQWPKRRSRTVDSDQSETYRRQRPEGACGQACGRKSDAGGDGSCDQVPTTVPASITRPAPNQESNH